MVVWGGRPPPPRGLGPTPIRSTCLTPKFLKQQDHILLSNLKHLTIAFLDISLGLLWFQKKHKISVFSKQKLWPPSLKKILDQHLLQYLIMRVKIEAYKFTVYHYHSHVHYYYTHQNMLDLPWEGNSLAPKWNNRQKNVVSLNNLLNSSQTNIMSGSIKGKKTTTTTKTNRTINMFAGIYHFPIHSNSFTIKIQSHMKYWINQFF